MSLNEWKIIGLILVKNEEYYVEQAIRNVLGFCDRIYALDHLSSDSTYSILKCLEKEQAKMEVYRISTAKESHRFIEGYVGSKSWVFAFDGDELYDPNGLKRLRRELRAGCYSEYFKLTGNCLHCESLDVDKRRAVGYMSPPARSVTKLYNFFSLLEWSNVPNERLHGGTIRFKDGFNDDKRLHFGERVCWENANLRCLHLCFIKRSSLQEESEKGFVRLNISDISSKKPWYVMIAKYLGFAMKGQLYRQKKISGWKLASYRKGDLKQVDVESFLLGDID